LIHVPDFVDAVGVQYLDIEITVESDSEGGIRDAVQLGKTLERPLKTREGAVL
jgi:hypothetical protein